MPVIPRKYRSALALLLLAQYLGTAGVAAHAADDKNAKPYALIFGTVWGPDDLPVYGVKIKVRRAEDKKPKWELYSDHRGEFAQRVPVGKADYVVTADLKGFKLADGRQPTAEPVNVHIDGDERADIGVHLK
jgi:hypothetical protein